MPALQMYKAKKAEIKCTQIKGKGHSKVSENTDSPFGNQNIYLASRFSKLMWLLHMYRTCRTVYEIRLLITVC